MEQLIHIAVWVLGLMGGAHKLENILEHYIMDHVPDKFKPLVVPVVSAAFAVVAAVHGGIDPVTAGLGALGFAGYTDAVHNNPGSTSAAWAAPVVPEKPSVDTRALRGDRP